MTAGNFLGLYLRATAAAGSSDPTVVITDSQSNVWVRDYSVDDGSGYESINFYHCLNAKSSAANTITITMSGGGASTYYYSAACFEYSGVGALDTVAPYAYPSGAGAFPRILTSGPSTIFGCTPFGSGSIAAGAGFTLRAQINGVYDNIEDQYSSTSGPFSVAFTNKTPNNLRTFGVAYQAIAYSISGSRANPTR